MIQYTDYYAILQLSTNATFDEIKSAYRKQAMIHHPDKNNNSSESNAKFKVINNAYNNLIDQKKREKYDFYVRSSHSINQWKKTNRKALPGKTDIFKSLDTITTQLNFILWDIDDLIKYKTKPIWNKEFNGLEFRNYILRILIFIDKWVLDVSGYTDYFMQARKREQLNLSEYEKFFKNTSPEHRPFIDETDYFYNIRRRINKYINKITISDLLEFIPNSKLRIIDCLIETENYSVHYISSLFKVITDESQIILPFQYSNPFLSFDNF